MLLYIIYVYVFLYNLKKFNLLNKNPNIFGLVRCLYPWITMLTRHQLYTWTVLCQILSVLIYHGHNESSLYSWTHFSIQLCKDNKATIILKILYSTLLKVVKRGEETLNRHVHQIVKDFCMSSTSLFVHYNLCLTY